MPVVTLFTSAGRSFGSYGPVVPEEVEYVVVAGGGGGGSNIYGGGGGGGAGGYRSSVSGESSGGGGSAESPLTIVKNTLYTVTVGNGGGTNANGQNSVLGSVTSIGGGRGAAEGYEPSTTGGNGATGGSGGGAGGDVFGYGVLPGESAHSGGAGVSGQGYAGGGSGVIAVGTADSGGGGGASAVGLPGNDYGPIGTGATGGAGVTSSITGSAVVRAHGGNGRSARHSTTSNVSAANIGEGGDYNRAGGSGIVIIRYDKKRKNPTIGAGLTYSLNIVGDYTVIEFTAGSDTISW